LTYGEKFVIDKGVEVLGYPGTWAMNRDECIKIEDSIKNEMDSKKYNQCN